jgi:membrane protease YdiL (CAAX protease family)
VSYNISVQLIVRLRIASLFGLFLTGTFFEEVFYRGYLTERMTVLTKHRWATAFGFGIGFGIKLYPNQPTNQLTTLAEFRKTG